jgi:hypothetical protein
LAFPYRLAHLLSYGGVVLTLIFILPGGRLNFSAWFMKNVLFEEKKMKRCNKRHLVESRTYAAFRKNAGSFLVDYMELICTGVFCTCVGFQKVKINSIYCIV